MSESSEIVTLHDAIKADDIEKITNFIKEGADINDKEIRNNPAGFNTVQLACFNNSLESLHWLLWNGAELNDITNKGWSAVHICAIKGNNSCLQALISNNASLNLRDKQGVTPLHLASSHGNSFSLQLLLRSGCNVMVSDNNGWLGTHYASYQGRLGCLQLLHKWGCPLTEVDNNGNTPAHLAAQEGNLPCLKFIISQSSFPKTQVLSCRNDAGEVTKDLATRFYKSNIVEFLQNFDENNLENFVEDDLFGENLAFPAHVAASKGNVTSLKHLIEQGIIDINERDEKGSTPAHKAAGNNQAEVLQYLIHTGADMEIRNLALERPLDVAIRFAQFTAIKLLGGSVDDDDNLSSSSKSDCEFSSINNSSCTKKKRTLERARFKVDEFEEKLEIAKENFRQLGGVLDADLKKMHEINEDKQVIEKLKAELSFERLKKENLEVNLDELKSENLELNCKIEDLADEVNEKNQILYEIKMTHKTKRKNKKKINKRAPLNGEPGIFIRRTFD